MNRMRILREQQGATMKEIAKSLKMPYTTYVNYEKGLREPSSETLVAIASFFNVSVDYLIGNDAGAGVLQPPQGFMPLPKMVKVPIISSISLVGSIACGTPILAEENIEDMINMPENTHADFALRCKGDSMTEARINDGDIVFIRAQPTVENGEIAAVRIGEEATLKRIYISDGSITLMPCNSKYPPITYIGTDAETVHIEGKAVAFLGGIE